MSYHLGIPRALPASTSHLQGTTPLQPLRLAQKHIQSAFTSPGIPNCPEPELIDRTQMFSRAAIRATSKVAGRRGFHATRTQMSSPYHYPEGPYSNLPFNPKKKTFPILFWGYAITGFGAPFMIAGASLRSLLVMLCCSWKESRRLMFYRHSLANLQAQDIKDGPIQCCGGVGVGFVYESQHGHGGCGGWYSRIDSTIDILSNRVFLSPELEFPRILENSYESSSHYLPSFVRWASWFLGGRQLDQQSYQETMNAVVH